MYSDDVWGNLITQHKILTHETLDKKVPLSVKAISDPLKPLKLMPGFAINSKYPNLFLVYHDMMQSFQIMQDSCTISGKNSG